MTKQPSQDGIHDEIDKDNCGTRIRLVLDYSGMKLTELAKILGVDQATLAQVVPTGRERKGDQKQRKQRPAPDAVMNALHAISLVRPKDQSPEDADGSPKLTAASVMAGLAALALTKNFRKTAIIGGSLFGAIGAAAGGALTYGIIRALGAIGEKNEEDFDIEATDDSFEITPKKKNADDESN